MISGREDATPRPQTDVNRMGRRAAGALITPALFSQPPPRPPGEEGGVSRKEKTVFLAFSGPTAPLSPVRRAGGWERGVGGVRALKRRAPVRLRNRSASRSG